MASMFWKTLFALMTLSLVAGQLDLSGCEDCYTRYSTFITSTWFNSSYWAADDATAAADQACSIISDIHFNCFSTCAKTESGQVVPLLGDPKATKSKEIVEYHCIEHECRVADTLTCSLGKEQGRCTSEAYECESDLLKAKGCSVGRFCDKGERSAFINNLKVNIDCGLSYPDMINSSLVSDGDERHASFQLCKDIVVTKCLATWHKNALNQDYSRVIEYDDDFKQEYCGGEENNMVVNCLQSAMNESESIEYEGSEYSGPCDPTVMTRESAVLFRYIINDIALVSETCLDEITGRCEGNFTETFNLNSTETTETTELPQPDSETEVVEETTTELPAEEISTELPVEDNTTSTAEEQEKKVEEEPVAPEDPSTVGHENHDGHDHKDPGVGPKSPTGKSTEDNNSACVNALSLVLCSLIALTILL